MIYFKSVGIDLLLVSTKVTVILFFLMTFDFSYFHKSLKRVEGFRKFESKMQRVIRKRAPVMSMFIIKDSH